MGEGGWGSEGNGLGMSARIARARGANALRTEQLDHQELGGIFLVLQREGGRAGVSGRTSSRASGVS